MKSNKVSNWEYPDFATDLYKKSKVREPLFMQKQNPWIRIFFFLYFKYMVKILIIMLLYSIIYYYFFMKMLLYSLIYYYFLDEIIMISIGMWESFEHSRIQMFTDSNSGMWMWKGIWYANFKAASALWTCAPYGSLYVRTHSNHVDINFKVCCFFFGSNTYF